MAEETRTIARPYADAVFDRAAESEQLDLWSDMLKLMGALVRDAQIAGYLADPRFERARLTDLLIEIGAERFNEEGKNLLRLLVANDRVGLAPEIAELYEELKSQYRGSIDVRVTSAYAVTAAQKRALKEALREHFGCEINLQSERDRSLIAGLIIRAGDTVIDGSLRAGLGQLADALGAPHH
jgi:F-type H+-transporting ATPase subunit delta